MKSSDLALSVFIIFIFILLYVFNILSVGIKAIEDDWPTYRCNPVIMPFASVFGQNVMDNFTFCIQSMQTNYMGYLMQPLNYNLDVIGGLGAGLTTAVNDVRAFFNNIRDMTTGIVTDIFGLFLNILIEFQSAVEGWQYCRYEGCAIKRYIKKRRQGMLGYVYK